MPRWGLGYTGSLVHFWPAGLLPFGEKRRCASDTPRVGPGWPRARPCSVVVRHTPTPDPRAAHKPVVGRRGPGGSAGGACFVDGIILLQIFWVPLPLFQDFFKKVCNARADPCPRGGNGSPDRARSATRVRDHARGRTAPRRARGRAPRIGCTTGIARALDPTQVAGSRAVDRAKQAIAGAHDGRTSGARAAARAIERAHTCPRARRRPELPGPGTHPGLARRAHACASRGAVSGARAGAGSREAGDRARDVHVCMRGRSRGRKDRALERSRGLGRGVVG